MDTLNIFQCPEVTVKRFLLLRLQGAIAREGTISEIPLNRGKNSVRVVYVSAIALKLAKTWQQTPQAIATQLAATLEPLCYPDFAVKVAPAGIIELEMTDAGLAVWLQRLAQIPLPVPESRIFSPVVSADRLFPIQYSHARCCSLLRMAHRDRLISIAQPDVATAPQIWSLTAPNPIPWVDGGDRLRLVHPAEHNLISQLITVLDNLAPIFTNCSEKPVILFPVASELLVAETRTQQSRVPTQNNIVGTRHCRLLYPDGATGIDINYLKLANSLSAAFQTFYSQCRIWGEVKIETPKLAQARLGLVLATQSLLRFILEELLSVLAPLEL